MQVHMGLQCCPESGLLTSLLTGVCPAYLARFPYTAACRESGLGPLQ